jgi:hypothetical protein
MHDAAVVGSAYAPPLPRPPTEACSDAAGGGADGEWDGEYGECSCRFRRFGGVDNAALASRKPFFGYGIARLPLGASPSLEACERACCGEALCHSVVWYAEIAVYL